MPIVDTYKLCDIALGEGIVIEHWDFPKPLDAVYFFEPGLPPLLSVLQIELDMILLCIDVF